MSDTDTPVSDTDTLLASGDRGTPSNNASLRSRSLCLAPRDADALLQVLETLVSRYWICPSPGAGDARLLMLEVHARPYAAPPYRPIEIT
ncbi:MAG: hypothetical protein LBH75_06060 [Treponema sp.]|nr:hypothetical protein [Treponema sp.]